METYLLIPMIAGIVLIISYLSSERVIYYNNKIVKITNQLNERLKTENHILQKENEEWKIKNKTLEYEKELIKLTLSTSIDRNKYPLPYDVICDTKTKILQQPPGTCEYDTNGLYSN